MDLTINGETVTLIPIQRFREDYHLPANFGTAFFEPKLWDGLGAITDGRELNHVRDAVLGAIPHSIRMKELSDFVLKLGNFFRVKLYEINETVGLRPVEIDFASAGFDDLMQAYLYAVIAAKASGSLPVNAEAIYQRWLSDSIRITAQVHTYEHEGETWHVQILNTVYGRGGLRIDRGESVIYVRDGALACPAEMFMHGLIIATCDQLSAVLRD